MVVKMGISSAGVTRIYPTTARAFACPSSRPTFFEFLADAACILPDGTAHLKRDQTKPQSLTTFSTQKIN